MSLSLEALWKMSDVELLAAYHEVRRQHVERKFARDTQRARLDWLKARLFATSPGGVTERRNAVDAAEDLARKGQELREMTRDGKLPPEDYVAGVESRFAGRKTGALAKLLHARIRLENNDFAGAAAILNAKPTSVMTIPAASRGCTELPDNF